MIIGVCLSLSYFLPPFTFIAKGTNNNAIVIISNSGLSREKEQGQNTTRHQKSLWHQQTKRPSGWAEKKQKNYFIHAKLDRIEAAGLAVKAAKEKSMPLLIAEQVFIAPSDNSSFHHQEWTHHFPTILRQPILTLPTHQISTLPLPH